MQSPNEFSRQLREMIKNQITETNNAVEDGVKTYTNKEHSIDRLEFLLKYASVFDNVVNQSALQIYGVYEDETEVEMKGFKCNVIELDELLIIKTPEILNQDEAQEITDAIGDLQKKGAFGNKILSIMPYDIHCLKAKLIKDGVEPIDDIAPVKRTY